MARPMTRRGPKGAPVCALAGQSAGGLAGQSVGALAGQRAGVLAGRSAARARSAPEPLALLLLPTRLEDFWLQEQARSLLEIPRVIALEASRRRAPRWLQESADVRAAGRLRLEGALALVALYHPRQYPLARALRARHEQAELWYLACEPPAPWPARERERLQELDQLARANAHTILAPEDGDAPLRARLRELGVISAHAFVPSARLGLRQGPWSGPRPGPR